jgi:hypothetical protein
MTDPAAFRPLSNVPSTHPPSTPSKKTPISPEDQKTMKLIAEFLTQKGQEISRKGESYKAPSYHTLDTELREFIAIGGGSKAAQVAKKIIRFITFGLFFSKSNTSPLPDLGQKLRAFDSALTPEVPHARTGVNINASKLLYPLDIKYTAHAKGLMADLTKRQKNTIRLKLPLIEQHEKLPQPIVVRRKQTRKKTTSPERPLPASPTPPNSRASSPISTEEVNKSPTPLADKDLAELHAHIASLEEYKQKMNVTPEIPKHIPRPVAPPPVSPQAAPLPNHPVYDTEDFTRKLLKAEVANYNGYIDAITSANEKLSNAVKELNHVVSEYNRVTKGKDPSIFETPGLGLELGKYKESASKLLKEIDESQKTIEKAKKKLEGRLQWFENTQQRLVGFSGKPMKDIQQEYSDKLKPLPEAITSSDAIDQAKRDIVLVMSDVEDKTRARNAELESISRNLQDLQRQFPGRQDVIFSLEGGKLVISNPKDFSTTDKIFLKFSGEMGIYSSEESASELTRFTSSLQVTHDAGLLQSEIAHKENEIYNFLGTHFGTV